SKRGILTLMEVLAEELKGTGVTANAVAPSVIDTPANRLSMPDADWKRWIRPEDMASIILYLCSPGAREINGATLPIKGGM
ncbi:MAG: 3-oxoacyl-[acyl-carrier-protein] reductase, partial [Bacteroidetes bacterium]|nr:3-oxoacyl-[acyl-carrier-protein] reductase [Bacteroidota bacterium]